MGGIKNKLSKLSNKAKTLFSNLTSPTRLGSSASGTASRRTPASRAFDNSGLHSKPVGLLGITKYVGIACFTLALISTIGLNLYRTYSSSNTLSNAEQVDSGSSNNNELSTLANDSSICDPTNTNAAACISLSITPLTTPTSSPCDTSNSNICMKIPDDGGIATGGHTVEVSSNNVAGYYVMLTGNAGSPAMTPSATTSQAFIQSTTGTLANPTYLDKGQWGSWGIALPNSSLYTGFNTNEMDYSSTDQDVLHKTTWAAVPGKESDDSDKTIIKTTASSKKTDSYPIYYGVRVDSLVSVPADTYAAQVVYTATTNEVLMPTITSTSRNTYELGSGADSTVTITGTNLASTYKVYIESNADSTKQYDITSTVTNLTDTGLTVTIPTDQTNTDLEPGAYTIHVVTQGEEATALFMYREKPRVLSVYDPVDNVRVDWDQNMIPVYYTGTPTTPRWTSLNSTQIEQNPVTWFDYSGSRNSGEIRWANAVTVKDPAKYKDKSLVVDEEDVLGYWVYIPRYAYMVMRRDVTDKVVTDEEAAAMGGFNIKFETAEDVKKTPAACPYSSSSRYYYNCVPQSYPGNNESLKDSTAWATHPAFTWQYTKDINGFDETIELNGFWMGKFEMTGSLDEPTVLPDNEALGSNIGNDYDVAQSIGIEDASNTYGNSLQTSYNGGNGEHNLSTFMSHMIKNSEWGAAVYLSASKYGAGIGNVQLNDSYEGDSTGHGPNRGSYYTSDGQLASTTNNVYGVYDMAGGQYEYVMGGYTSSLSQSDSDAYLSFPAKPPYINLYYSGTFTDSSNRYANNRYCTWETCGGHSLHETKNVQSVSREFRQSWYESASSFVYNISKWFLRSSTTEYGGDDGIFLSGADSGRSLGSFRTILLTLQLSY